VIDISMKVNGETRSASVPAETTLLALLRDRFGLATLERLHPIQKAFEDNASLQCGFCGPGVIMSAKALLDENPDPSAPQIRDALAGNLCRCTGYVKMIEAVQDAARVLRAEHARAAGRVEST